MDDETKQVVDQYFNQPIFQQHDNTNLEAAPRYKHYGSSFRFKKCLILNSKEEYTESLLLGEPFSIYIEGIAYKDFENLDIAVDILSSERSIITKYLISEKNNLLKLTKEQEISLQLNYDDFKLNTGSYIITIKGGII